jgi:GNAT superfamily N-acetyltransferase
VSEAKIHAFLRAAGTGSERRRVGPFLLRLTAGTEHPMRNYAVPDDGIRPTVGEVRRLVDAFRERGLVPRLEYLESEAPELEAVLVAGGFVVEAHLPVMTCRPGQETPVPTPVDFAVFEATSDEDHADAMTVADEAYGEPAGRPRPEAIAGRRRQSEDGGAVGLARHRSTGAPAGTGLVAVPRRGVTELAAVGTRPMFEKHGVASAVAAFLVGHAFDRGIGVLWLTPDHEQGERLYSRIGFVRSDGDMVHISEPGPDRRSPV